jgi:hypothetical protein
MKAEFVLNLIVKKNGASISRAQYLPERDNHLTYANKRFKRPVKA